MTKFGDIGIFCPKSIIYIYIYMQTKKEKEKKSNFNIKEKEFLVFFI